jgi:hypothetical protein
MLAQILGQEPPKTGPMIKEPAATNKKQGCAVWNRSSRYKTSIKTNSIRCRFPQKEYQYCSDIHYTLPRDQAILVIAGDRESSWPRRSTASMSLYAKPKPCQVQTSILSLREGEVKTCYMIGHRLTNVVLIAINGELSSVHQTLLTTDANGQ